MTILQDIKNRVAAATAQLTTIRQLRLTSTWGSVRQPLQIWISDVANVLVQGIRIKQHCYADLAVLQFTAGDAFHTNYPNGIQLSQKVTSGPPLGLTAIAIYDLTAPGFLNTSSGVVGGGGALLPPQTPLLTWCWNNDTSSIYVFNVSDNASFPRVSGHDYAVVVRIDGA